jgi:hypothetical protein
MAGTVSYTESIRDELVDAFGEYATALEPSDIQAVGENLIIITTVDGPVFEVTVRRLFGG